MARPSKNYPTTTKTARMRLAVRPKPYFRDVGGGKSVGYIRRAAGPGSWVVREWIGGQYPMRIIGTADDASTADGRDVLTYDQAVRVATRPALPSPGGGGLLVEDALDSYLEAMAGRSSHAREARQRAEKHILPTLGRLRVDRLTKSQIEQWLAGLVKDADADDPDARRRSQDSANRVLTILKAALNEAFADDANSIPSDTAWRRVKAYRNVGAAREDHFDAAQVRLLIAKAATFDRAFATLLEAAYLTGARYGELVGLEVRDFDRDRALLTIRKGKTGARVVTLAAEAVVFFRRVAGKRPSGAILLPRADGNLWGKSEQARPFKRAAELAKLPASASLYTLRHSHISRACEAGMPLKLLAENVGTSLRMIETNYAKFLAGARRDLIEATSPKLRRVK